jgi:hypothetical protein
VACSPYCFCAQVYADGARVGDSLVQAIQAPTRAPAAASAFASILCSPPSPVPFAKMVETARDGGTPIALCYGKEARPAPARAAPPPAPRLPAAGLVWPVRPVARGREEGAGSGPLFRESRTQPGCENAPHPANGS